MSRALSRRSLLAIVFVLALPGLWPLLGSGYFLKAHDGPHSLFFLVEFDRAVRDGAFVPRWCTDQALGYGYPTFVFYSPLAYYLAEAFHLTGMGIATSIKATHAVALLLGLAGMFLCAEMFFGPSGGAVAALAYAYAPYRFVDMYVRSSLAEALALGLAPWALWAILRLSKRPDRKRLAGAGLAFGLMLLAHNVTGLLCAPLLGVIGAVGCFSRRRSRLRSLGWCAGAALLGLSLAAMSLLPAFAERRYIVESQWTHATYELQKHFVYLGQLLLPTWGYGYAVEGPADGMSFQLGVTLLCLAGAGVATWWRRQRELALGLVAVLSIYVILLLPLSAPAWQAVRPLALVQFPWRLLGPLVLCLAMLASGAARHVGRGLVLPALLFLPVLEGLAYAQPAELLPAVQAEQPVAAVDFELNFPDMRGVTAFAKGYPEDSPKVQAYLSGEVIPLAHSDVPGARIEVVHHGGHVQTVLVSLPQDGRVIFYTYYYPGWQATVDGRPASIEPWGPLALIAVPVPAGEHVLAIRFGETPLRMAANCASLAAGLVILFVSTLPRSGIKGRTGVIADGGW